jgi:CheY-like chemotaxis protein
MGMSEGGRSPADQVLAEATSRPTLNPRANSAAAPSGGSMGLDDDFALPERVFLEKLEERARRADLLTALLAAGGISPANAVLTLQSSLGAVAKSASEAGLGSLAQFVEATRQAIGNLGVGPRLDDELRVVDTVVFDENELQRDLVALAVEARGHTVRCVASYDELVRELDQRHPGMLVTEVEHAGIPPRAFCSTLKDLLADKNIPVVLFSGTDAADLHALAAGLGARRHVSKDKGVDALMTALEDVYHQILATRSTGRHSAFRFP